MRFLKRYQCCLFFLCLLIFPLAAGAADPSPAQTLQVEQQLQNQINLTS